MRMMFESFARGLLGIRYGRVFREMAVCALLFWAFHSAGYQIRIASEVLYIMSMLCAAGVMWRTVSSAENAEHLDGLLMLPFHRQKLIFACVGACGIYTLFTAVMPLTAVLAAVAVQGRAEWVLSCLCAGNGIGMAAAVWLYRKHKTLMVCWGAFQIMGIFCLETGFLRCLLAGDLVLVLLLLAKADAYELRLYEEKGKARRTGSGKYAVFRYFVRYLTAHKNYLANTGMLAAVAAALPLFFQGMDRQFVLPIGFAILSLNTPLGVLLSCDPSLERAVRSLPGQIRGFFAPYGVFVFLCNGALDLVFLGSWQICGNQTLPADYGMAVLFCVLGAAGTVFMEYFFPIREWKTENDLWRHPRKYVVPAALLLAAGIVCEVLVL